MDRNLTLNEITCPVFIRRELKCGNRLFCPHKSCLRALVQKYRKMHRIETGFDDSVGIIILPSRVLLCGII